MYMQVSVYLCTVVCLYVYMYVGRYVDLHIHTNLLLRSSISRFSQPNISSFLRLPLASHSFIVSRLAASWARFRF